MTDLERAIAHLPGHTLVLCRGEDTLISDKRGVAPMVDFWQEGRDLRGYSAADRVGGIVVSMLPFCLGADSRRFFLSIPGGKPLGTQYNS